jgi:hypothetical protein
MATSVRIGNLVQAGVVILDRTFVDLRCGCC